MVEDWEYLFGRGASQSSGAIDLWDTINRVIEIRENVGG